jgi:TPR repeat protein
MRNIARLLITSLLAVAVFAAGARAADYDPALTLGALNMAVASLHRITASESRVVLDAEYKNIIDNLRLGSIEDDPELKELYKELLTTIGGRALRAEEAERVSRRYGAAEKNRLTDMLSAARFSPANPWGFVGGILAGEAARYFGARNLARDESEGEDGELWRLERENIEDMTSLQKRLLDSSWTLLRRYGLPDEYRLTQGDLDALDSAIAEENAEKKLRMFKALEPNFKMYAPFWYYYAAAAESAGDAALSRACLGEFDRAWRPILRRDPFKAEAAKLRAGELIREGASRSAIAAQLAIVTENSAREDWVANLFAGTAYYSIGEAERAMELVAVNVDFGAEREVSASVLQNMRGGKFDAEIFADAAQSAIASSIRGYSTAGGQSERGLIAWFRGDNGEAASLLSGKIKGDRNSPDPLPYHVLSALTDSAPARNLAALAGALPDARSLASPLAAAVSQAPATAYSALLPIAKRYADSGSANAKIFMGDMYAKGLGVSQDIAEAIRLYSAPAEEGSARARRMLGEIFETASGFRDEAKAAEYYALAAEGGSAQAAVKIGDMRRDGRGGGKNPEDAYMWYHLALLEGEAGAKSKIDELEGRGLLKFKSVNAATANRARERAEMIFEAIGAEGER